jgi:hypothetical protein
MRQLSLELGFDGSWLVLLWCKVRFGLEAGESNGGAEIESGLELLFNCLCLFD